MSRSSNQCRNPANTCEAYVYTITGPTAGDCNLYSSGGFSATDPDSTGNAANYNIGAVGSCANQGNDHLPGASFALILSLSLLNWVSDLF